MINELVQRFKIHLEEDGKSSKTIESYSKNLITGYKTPKKRKINGQSNYP